MDILNDDKATVYTKRLDTTSVKYSILAMAVWTEVVKMITIIIIQ